MVQDPITRRAHQPVQPADPADPSTGASFLEAVQDAFYERLTAFFAKSFVPADRRVEVPAIRKYMLGYAAGEDPLTTFAKLVEEFPDLPERLPHVAILGVSGTEKPLAIGRPLIASVQSPPRIVSAVGPFALAVAVAEVRSLTVAAVSASGYAFNVAGTVMTVPDPGGSTADAARVIAQMLRTDDATGLAFSATAAGNVVTVAARTAGMPFALVSAQAGLVAALVQAAGAAADGTLAVRTLPDLRNPTVSSFVINAGAYPLGVPPGATTAQVLADAIAAQALYVDATALPSGALDLRPRQSTPNEIEVVPAAGGGVDIAPALGLAVTGPAGAGWTVTVDPATDNVILTAAAGTPFAAGVAVGQYATLSGWLNTNDGRWLILGVTSSVLTLANNPDAPAVADVVLVGDSRSPTWYVGARDDWLNPVRPVKHRYAGPSMDVTVAIEIYAEDVVARKELRDLVVDALAFFQEETFFTWYGRSVFDEAIPDEWMQISLSRQLGATGDSDFARPGGDEKSRVWATHVTVPAFAARYRDREMLVPFGPRAGTSWTLLPGDVTSDDAVPSPT